MLAIVVLLLILTGIGRGFCTARFLGNHMEAAVKKAEIGI
jgi:hypothetical protein